MRLLTGTEGKQTKYGALVTYCLKFGNMKDILHRILTMWVQWRCRDSKEKQKWTQYQERLINCINSCLGSSWQMRSEHCIEQSEIFVEFDKPTSHGMMKKKSLVEVVSGGKAGSMEDRTECSKSRSRMAIMELITLTKVIGFSYALWPISHTKGNIFCTIFNWVNEVVLNIFL